MYESRVRAHQTDLNGAMYHGAYLDLFDDARIEAFRSIGYTYQRMRAGGWTAVIRRIDCTFTLVAEMDEVPSVRVQITGFTRATMTLHYDCRRGEDKIAEAEAVFAFVDKNRRAVPVPLDLKQTVVDNKDW